MCFVKKCIMLRSEVWYNGENLALGQGSIMCKSGGTVNEGS